MKNKLDYNLQFFADPTDPTDPPADPPAPPVTDPPADPPAVKTLDDILADEKYKSEYETRLQKALEEQKAKLEVLYNDKASEAEKLAKMTEAEKAAYLQQQREKALADKEAAITRRELMAEAKNNLAEKKLPAGLADVLAYTDAEACKRSIDAVETAFQAAVESAVNEQLKGGNPPKKAPQGDPAELEKQIYNLMSGRQ